MAETEKKRCILMAKTAKVRKKYNTMILHIKEAVKTRVAFDDEERRFLAEAYLLFLKYKSKLLLPMARSIIRENIRLVTKICRKQMNSYVINACKDMLELLNRYLIPNATDNESKIFYFKLKGDYHISLRDATRGGNRINEAINSFRAYVHAARLAKITLPITHPLRLEVTLSISKYYYNIKKSPKKAYTLAKQAYNEAQIEVGRMQQETVQGRQGLAQLGQYISLLQEKMESYEKEPEKGRKPVKRNQQERVTFTTDDEEEKQPEKKLRETK